MPYVKRGSGGKIVGMFKHSTNKVTEFLNSDDPEVLAFVSPPPPTASKRVEAAFTPSDKDKIMFESLFELVNRVRELEGIPTVTRTQFKTWLKDKLP